MESLKAALADRYTLERELGRGGMGMPFALRVAWTSLAVPLPIFFAGLVFSSTFRETSHPPAAF